MKYFSLFQAPSLEDELRRSLSRAQKDVIEKRILQARAEASYRLAVEELTILEDELSNLLTGTLPAEPLSTGSVTAFPPIENSQYPKNRRS